MSFCPINLLVVGGFDLSFNSPENENKKANTLSILLLRVLAVIL
jgi:hypothetical protein